MWEDTHRTELLCFFHQLLFLFKLDIIISGSFLKKKQISICNLYPCSCMSVQL